MINYESFVIGVLAKRKWCILLKDPDIVGDLVTTAMMADHNFDGRGNIHGYRTQCVVWKAMDIIRKYKSRKNQLVQIMDPQRITQILDNDKATIVQC